ncbi:MAG: 4Fe-4S dicluster domain-containing protein [Desulfuromonadaceae bacterium]
MDTEPVVLFGVHFYDIKGLDMTDLLFNENHSDINYMAKRKAATVIGSSIQNISPDAFWGSVGKEVTPKGHDGFITKISAGYHYDTRNQKGEALVAFGNFQTASPAQIEEARQVNENMLGQCGKKLDYSSKEIAEKVREAFNDHELWEKLAEDCFSCGSCNTTCPTCYCFDVQDKWNLNQVSGMRNRYWDSCLTEDFAKISLGGGAEENFRETRGERFRHRIMRKLSYLNEKLGGPACTGCGRCAASCTANIADPVDVVNSIMKDKAQEKCKCEFHHIAPEGNIFLPKECKIVRVKQVTATERHYTLRHADGSKIKFAPGQFLEMSLFGYGEIPLGYASSPTRENSFDIVVRTVGRVSTALNNLAEGDSVYVRGPLGTGFPVAEFTGQDVLVVAGGIGLCPTRSMIQYITDKRQDFKKFTLFYGVKEPAQQMFHDDILKWKAAADVDYHEIVDKPDNTWTGNVGVITALFSKTEIAPDTRVIICGPPVMFKFVIAECDKLGISRDNIFVDLERRMKCGVGKCGHCQINDQYVCCDGPVFRFSAIQDLEEAF